MARLSRSRAASGWLRAAARVRAVAVVALLASSVLAACGGQGDPSEGAPPRRPVAIENDMAERPSGWQTGPVDGDARLDFVPTGYRMTAGGWPLIAPSMDPRAAGLDPVVVRAELQPVSGRGLYGVACGVTEQRAFVFVVGEQEQGDRFYGIASLQDGVATSLQDSTAAGMRPAGSVVRAGGPVAVEARCRSGGGGSYLAMSVDGEQVASVHVPDAAPRGQVGLVALSRTARELVVDVGHVVIRAAD